MKKGSASDFPVGAWAAPREPPILRPNFRSFVWPVTRDDFFGSYWEQRHLVSHAPARRLAAIERELGPLDIEAFAASCDSAYAVSDVRTGPHPPKDAVDLYRSGMTLYLHDIEALQPWVDGLSSEVGASGRGAGSVFASPAGARVSFHFDPGELFTIQLRGRKRWQVAPNDHVRNPHSAWATNTPVPERMRLYCSEELPREGPRESETFEVAPGSVLYLPRGYWHATETLEDSLSVEIGLPLFTWADVVIDAMRTLFFSREEWRDRALGAWGNERQRSDARSRLESLLAGLGHELERLRPEDLVPTSPSDLPARAADPSTRYRRNPLAGFGIEETAGSGDRGLTTVRLISYSLLHLKTREYELDRDGVELCRWAAAQSEVFTGEQARNAARALPAEAVAGLLEALVDAEFLRLAP